MLNIEGFARVQDRTTTTLEGSNNHVDIDWEKKSYSVTLDGAEVARETALRSVLWAKTASRCTPSRTVR
jgi:hypothetical protein